VPDDCLYQHPQAVRALQHAVDALEHHGRRHRARNSMPPNSRKPWTDEEDVRLSEELRRGADLHEIAAVDLRSGSPGTPVGTYNLQITVSATSVAHSAQVKLVITQ